jgi:hypothetical protein
MADTGAVGMSSAATAGVDWRFWAGSVTPASAPFRVDESGNLVATNATISGTISIGSGNNIFIADSNGICLGNATFGSAPFRVTMAGALTASSATVTGALTTSSGSNLNADYLTAGTVSVGGSSQPGYLLINKQGGTGNQSTNAYLRWVGGSRMWEDSSNNVGLNAIGGTFVVYTDSTERFQSNTTGMNISQTVHCQGLVLDQGQNEGNIERVDKIKGYNDLRFEANGDYKFFRDNSENNGVRFEWGTGKIHSYDSNIDLGGTDKTAIVPVGKEYRALYAAESPEVWLFDFAKDKASIDPMFLDVTEGDVKTLTTDEGELLVFRRRKYHADKRFQLKTMHQFQRNEAFLKMAK